MCLSFSFILFLVMLFTDLQESHKEVKQMHLNYFIDPDGLAFI